jgi:hypothetical protein
MQLMTALSIITFPSIMGVSLLGLSQAFGQIDENNNPTSTINEVEWKTYSSDKVGFSMEYSSDWIVIEKTNRFDTGDELVIKASEDPSDSQFALNGIVADTLIPDTTIFTQITKKSLIGNYFNVDYERHLVEDVNPSKYVIGGEKANSFTYGSTVRGTDIATVGAEVVITYHNNKDYLFHFDSEAQSFDPQMTAIST